MSTNICDSDTKCLYHSLIYTTMHNDSNSFTTRYMMIAVLFGSTIFLSSYLLFQIQLIVAKNLLPWFGGVSSVWTTCMLLFQVLLLLGYGWSYSLTKKIRLKKQVILHIVVLSATIAFMLYQYRSWSVPLLPPDSLFQTASSLP